MKKLIFGTTAMLMLAAATLGVANNTHKKSDKSKCTSCTCCKDCTCGSCSCSK